ncbi:MAG TPA: SRPBCC domain-containing protein [Chryseolinea sp.]|nr:SRPBCC domain-containing protein [Chryseolinea sp.]
MKNTLLFDFTVDKSTSTVFVYREFAAESDLVWNAFTEKEILDQWWAPKPWLSRTKRMNFEVGGRRLYAMVSPEGHEHWSIQHYTAIIPITNFKFVSAFADQDENINKEFPSSKWNLDFSEFEGVTKVDITIKHKELADLERHLQMGFKEAFTGTLNDLDQLLTNLNVTAK